MDDFLVTLLVNLPAIQVITVPVVQFYLDYCAIVVFPTDSPVGVTCPKEQLLRGAPGLVEIWF